MNDSTLTAVTKVPVPDGAATELPWWAKRRGFGWLSLITGFFSLLAAGVLVGERLQIYIDANHTTSCDFGGAFSCSSVMRSSAAQAFGFPNPFIGLVGFTILVVIAVTVLSGASMPRWYWVCHQIGLTFAWGFLVWLYTEAVYEIGALCLYCMICWFMITLAFVITTARNVLVGVLPAPVWLHRWARNWAWITAIVLLLACAATIIIHFRTILFA